MMRLRQKQKMENHKQMMMTTMTSLKLRVRLQKNLLLRNNIMSLTPPTIMELLSRGGTHSEDHIPAVPIITKACNLSGVASTLTYFTIFSVIDGRLLLTRLSSQLSP